MKPKLSILVLTLIILAVSCFGTYSIGLEVGRGKVEVIEVPVVNTTNTTIEKPVFIDREVEVFVEKVVTEFVEVPVYPSCREFSTLAELASWLDVNMAVLWPVEEFDCDDYAERLQIRAASDGYLLSCHLVENGKIYGIRVSDDTGPHMGNMAIVQNDVFFIEPQPGIFRIIKICVRD